MVRTGKFLLLILFLISSIVFVNKEAQTGIFDALEQDAEIEIIVGELKSIAAYSPTRVSVTNPAIADIEKATEKEILLVAKSAGTTRLTIWEKTGERSILIRVYPEDLDRLNARLKELLSFLKIDFPRDISSF